MAIAPGNIDKFIVALEAEEVAAIEKGEGGRTLAFVRMIEAQSARRLKKELVAGGDLPDTPDPVKPKAATAVLRK